MMRPRSVRTVATIVSVKVRGKDQNEFNQRLNGYLPDSKVTVTRPGGYHPFGSDYIVTPEIKLSSKLGSYSAPSSSPSRHRLSPRWTSRR